MDSLEVAARALNNIIGGATLTGTNGKPTVQPGLEGNPANCAKYTGSSAVVAHAGFPSLCAQPVNTATGQAALVADAYKQWVRRRHRRPGLRRRRALRERRQPGERAGPGDPQEPAPRELKERKRNSEPRTQPASQNRNVEEGDVVHPVRKPTWQQATALVSLSTCGAMTGFAFAHGTVGEMTSPTRMPVSLMALKKAATPATPSASGQPSGPCRRARRRCGRPSSRSARYYLRMAQTKSPAEMEAMIWGQDSVDGADHGQSCAAFASLTLALGAQATGQQSWVTGGTTYPWPLHQWADVRVDTNPDSPQITSVMQDAQAHDRWHPLGDGYRPQPGDWVLFEGHVEVVTKYAGGVLYTIGGDSAPNLSVNAHTFTGSLAGQGVTGFVNNGDLASAAARQHGVRRRFRRTERRRP